MVAVDVIICHFRGRFHELKLVAAHIPSCLLLMYLFRGSRAVLFGLLTAAACRNQLVLLLHLGHEFIKHVFFYHLFFFFDIDTAIHLNSIVPFYRPTVRFLAIFVPFAVQSLFELSLVFGCRHRTGLIVVLRLVLLWQRPPGLLDLLSEGTFGFSFEFGWLELLLLREEDIVRLYAVFEVIARLLHRLEYLGVEQLGLGVLFLRRVRPKGGLNDLFIVEFSLALLEELLSAQRQSFLLVDHVASDEQPVADPVLHRHAPLV